MKRVDLEQWRAEEVARLLALVEAERRYYQDIVASVPVGLAVLDEDLTFLSANKTFRTIFGLEGNRLVKTRLEDLFPGEAVRTRAREVLDTSLPQKRIGMEFATDSGTVQLRLSIQPFRGWNEEASLEILLLVETPVELETPLLAGPLKCEAKPETLRATELLENLDAIIWERDTDSKRFSHASGRSEDILGYPAEKWLESNEYCAGRVHPADRERVEAFFESTISSGTSRSCEYRALKADGRTVWLRDIVRPALDNDGKAQKLSGITIDISAEKQQSQQLAQAEKMAALGRLTGRVTHDCNNLLMILSGYGEEMLSKLSADHPAREDAEEILATTERLAKITQELLAFTRRPLLQPKVLDLNSLLNSLEEKLRHELGESVQFELDLDDNLGHVNADSEAFANTILSLAERARQAMPEGGHFKIRTASTEFRADRPHVAESLVPGTYVALTISDTGPQLDEETRTRFFEPFYSSQHGGQGLQSIYNVVRGSGGDILVTSEPKGGAVFTIYLPQIDAPAKPAVPTPQPPQAAVQPMETVLVVEDESGIRALMRKILERQGYKVLEASRGEEALRISDEHAEPIHLLLTDIVMPQMSGRELANQLRSSRPDIKVVFVSGYADEDMMQYGPLPAGSAFLQKPFSLAALLEKTRSVLNGGPEIH